MGRKKKDKDYLSNKEMFEELIKCQDIGAISDRLGKMFMILSKKYASKPNFSGYSYQDEMIAAGVLACCNAFNKFKREKTNNPFAYFTQCIHTAFLQVLNKEKNHQIIRDEMLIENGMNPSENFDENHKLKKKKKTKDA